MLRQRRGAGERACARAQVVLVDERLLGERQHDRRDDIGERDPVVLHDLQELLQVEARHRHDRRAEVQAEVHDHDHAVDVEEGQDTEHDVVVRRRSSTRADWSMFATRLWCVSITPFGRPVVPLE